MNCLLYTEYLTLKHASGGSCTQVKGVFGLLPDRKKNSCHVKKALEDKF